MIDFSKLIFLLAALFMLTSGCVASQSSGRNNSGNLSLAAKPCAAPMTYQKYFSSAPERPSWIDFPLADTKKNHFLVGMSEFHKTEKGARKSAMRAARNEFARYTGVEVTELDEFVMETYGNSDTILNEKVSGKATTKQASSAMVRRTKAREWYYEKLRGSCGGVDKGTAWQHWVLAVVPHDEYNAVQKWKDQKARLVVKKKMEAASVSRRNRTENIRLAHQKTVEKANRQLEKNEPVSALIALQNDITKINAETVLLEKTGKEYFSDTSALQTLKEQSYSLIHAIASSLIIDTGRNAMVFLPADKKGFINVKAWVFFKHRGRVQPVSGFHLSIIKEGSEKPASLAKSDATGKAVFRPDSLFEGSYKVRIDNQNLFAFFSTARQLFCLSDIFLHHNNLH